VVAKTTEAHARLQRSLASSLSEKSYLAVVYGLVTRERGPSTPACGGIPTIGGGSWRPGPGLESPDGDSSAWTRVSSRGATSPSCGAYRRPAACTRISRAHGRERVADCRRREAWRAAMGAAA
jgi:hypothetical protein